MQMKGLRGGAAKFMQKSRIAWYGFKHAVLTDFNVAYKVVLSWAAIILALVFQAWLDLVTIVLSAGLMVMAEIFNSAIEMLCDMVQPHEDTRIKAVKDMSAAAASICVLVWMTVMLVQLVRLLYHLHILG